MYSLINYFGVLSNYCTGFKDIATDTTFHTYDERMNVHEVFSAKVCIQPPDDLSCCSDGDSGDEENAGSSRLSRHQLLAPITIEIVNPSGPLIIGENEICQTIPTNNFSISSTESTSSKRRKKIQNLIVVGERKIWRRINRSGSGKAVLLL